MHYNIGIDIGSTTIKEVVLNENNQIVDSAYLRHFSFIKKTLTKLINDIIDKYSDFTISFTGSGAISFAKILEVCYVQEVVAGVKAIETFLPDTDIAIELGGEDAKITYLSGELDQRMNSSCAGGTGAFIDQMATLLDTDPLGLNMLAKNSKIIYPIASRCGVFAKSDIQPLINDGAKKEDLAASIFQAVVNQTITSLACGKPIKGNIAFLGGPLHFLDFLVKLFVKTIQPKKYYCPPNSELFNAIGVALLNDNKIISANKLKEKLKNLDKEQQHEIQRLKSLFIDESDYNNFQARHNVENIKKGEFASGPCFLGIDAGSTTTKVALINEKKELLYSFYESNKGDPLKSVIKALSEIYDKMPNESFIGYATATGYGEYLITSALHVDEGLVETMAHYIASKAILPDVQFILDIGGQDMKCLKIKDDAINDIVLNEACSAGCGSFLETFAKANDLSVEEFAKLGIYSKNPVDLGSRCTVFMNSRIKQAQKEGATLKDISAGLAHSIISNALYKVIKIRNTEEIGDKIIVQGGTFLNDLVLKAMENLLNKQVIRPKEAGIMGAYGAALNSLNNYIGEKSKILSKEEIQKLTIKKSTARCQKCNNNCLLTITQFQDGNKFISNNRCERGASLSDKKNDIKPNMFKYKYERLFDYYKPLDKKEATRGTVGLPRVLNMYENYPFWFTFFHNLSFRVELSPPSSHELYTLGLETIPSDSVCYPAKLVHGHIVSLLKKNVDLIFYPCIPYERKEDKNADNHYNCPIVGTYPEVIKNNMLQIFEDKKLICAFLPYNNKARLIERLKEEFEDIPKNEIKKAVEKAYKEEEKFKFDCKKYANKILETAEKNNTEIIILAGRPYHLDPEINHGIPELISEKLGFAVLTEDSVSRLAKTKNLRVVNQWMYHSRLYAAAEYIKDKDNINLIQLNSFGCGLDAITTDQVQEILAKHNKLYTTIKIDEVNNLGAAKIRLRSLANVLKKRKNIKSKLKKDEKRYIEYTKSMKGYTLLAPQFSPFHMPLLKTAVTSCSHNVEVLEETKNAIEIGLKYVNNDACYPSIITIGQIINTIQNGNYDKNKLAIILSQTGGGCRATNYIPLLRKALKESGYPNIPVVSLGMVKMEKHSGFKFSLKMKKQFLRALFLGDLLMRCSLRVRPYEKNKGETDIVYSQAEQKCIECIQNNPKNFNNTVNDVLQMFDNIPIDVTIKKPKIGIVGEILVKYNPLANNNIIKTIEEEGGEAVVPDMLNFFTYGFYNDKTKRKLLDGNLINQLKSNLFIKFIERMRKPIKKALKNRKYGQISSIDEIADLAKNIVSLGNMFGEGWFLTGEIVELIELDIKNILCVQPFACLPNHVTGKGVMKILKEKYKDCNIMAIDYDPGASEVNQINRIKLLMANAYKNLNK